MTTPTKTEGKCTCEKCRGNALALTPKQHKMIYELSDVDEIMWGGEAGGGKSEGLLMFALRRRLECPGSVGLAMRRTFPDLDKSLIRKSQRYYKPFAKWHEAKKKWVFKNGSIQDYGFCENDKDVYQYQSAEYDDIEIDELTQWSEFMYTYMLSRLRSASGKYKTLMRSATNPGNIGHLWVKARFVDPARDTVHKEFDTILGTYKTRYFLPAGLDDNTLMTDAQRREYKSWLAQLPPDQKKMLMEGDWDYVIGAAFEELNRKYHAYSPEEFPVPHYAKIFMSYDFGFGAPFSLGWWWVDYDGRMWRFAEWYGWDHKPNKGLRMSPSQVAKGIFKIEKDMKIEDRVTYRVAGPDIFSKTPNIRGGGQGPAPSEMFDEHGIHFTPGDPDRPAGKSQVHERFRVSEEFDKKNPLTYPMMMISNKCVNWWRTVPVLSSGDWGTPRFDDVEDKQEDHCYDETKIACMSRPIKPIHEKPEDTFVKKIMNKVETPQSADNDEELFRGIYDY